MQKLRNVIILSVVTTVIGFVAALFVVNLVKTKTIEEKKKERILDKYSIESLTNASITPASLTFDKESNKFLMEFDPAMDGDNKKVTGQALFPESTVKSPIVLMLRGYVDKEIYQSGIGTKHAAEYFAKNGYITLAPDFLGYAESDSESQNLFESRFQTYTTMLSLLAAADQVPGWDGKNIYIWAHSNGGQVALTTLEITGKDYPTTLWAPVSAPFPFSILYYQDGLPDYGKYLRRELALFEADYDSDLYSVHKYFDRIKAPIQVEQGTGDKSVPVEWSDVFVKSLKENEIDVTYFTYPGADHNMVPSWDLAIARDLVFFEKNIK